MANLNSTEFMGSLQIGSIIYPNRSVVTSYTYRQTAGSAFLYKGYLGDLVTMAGGTVVNAFQDVTGTPTLTGVGIGILVNNSQALDSDSVVYTNLDNVSVMTTGYTIVETSTEVATSSFLVPSLSSTTGARQKWTVSAAASYAISISPSINVGTSTAPIWQTVIKITN